MNIEKIKQEWNGNTFSEFGMVMLKDGSIFEINEYIEYVYNKAYEAGKKEANKQKIIEASNAEIF